MKKSSRKSYLKTKKAYEKLACLYIKGVEKYVMSERNKKLVPNDETAFLIWNLPARMTCPGKTEHCSIACYAIKAERAYPDCKPARIRNLLDSTRDDFVDRMTFTILEKRRTCKKKWLIVRIHESGDFYNQKYANAWLQIMRNCTGEKIKFIAYTKSFSFFDGKILPKNFYLRASIWDDTPAQDLEIIARNGWHIYTAVEKFQKGDTFYRCRCEDCAGCGHCWSARHDIRCEIH